MKLTELLATREQELLKEIASLEKVEQSLKGCRDELDAVRQSQEIVLNKTPLLKPGVDMAEPSVVSDILLLREEFDRKYATHR